MSIHNLSSDRQSLTRRAFVGVGTLAIVGSLAGCLGRGFSQRDEVTEAVTKTFAPADVRELRVINAIGDVTVRALDTDGIDVRVLKRSVAGMQGLDDITVRIGVENGVLTVATSLADDARWFTRSSPGRTFRSPCHGARLDRSSPRSGLSSGTSPCSTLVAIRSPGRNWET